MTLSMKEVLLDKTRTWGRALSAVTAVACSASVPASVIDRPLKTCL